MVDVKELKAILVRNDMTHEDIAKIIGISSRTFGSRLKKKIFGSDEIEIMIHALDIKDPMPIFFAPLVTYKDTKPQKSA